MHKITIKEAARMLGIGEQGVRMMIQNGCIAGATCYGPKHKRTYYVTDAQIINHMKGGQHAQGEPVF